MLKEEEKQELMAYQAKLVMLDEKKEKGHLTSEERDKITILLTENHSIRTIAKILGHSASTISRELKRSNAVYYRGKYTDSQTHINVKADWLKTHCGIKLNNLAIRKVSYSGIKTLLITATDCRTTKRKIWYKNSSRNYLSIYL